MDVSIDGRIFVLQLLAYQSYMVGMEREHMPEGHSYDNTNDIKDELNQPFTEPRRGCYENPNG